MITQIGPYYLNQPIIEAPNLTELSAVEYASFAAAGAPKMLPNEKMYNAGNVLWENKYWDVMIGASYGKIYKIAGLIFMHNLDDADIDLRATFLHFVQLMGEPSEKISSHKFIWFAKEGSVILETTSKLGYHALQFFLTAAFDHEQQESINKFVKHSDPWGFRNQFKWEFIFYEIIFLLETFLAPSNVRSDKNLIGVFWSTITAILFAAVTSLIITAFVKLKRKFF